MENKKINLNPINNFYDLVIIGAGPAAISFLNNFPLENKKVAVINGMDNKLVLQKKIHPKISHMSFYKGQIPKISEFLINKKNKEKIYSSSSVGGFTNYWGRQFMKFLPNNPTTNKHFKDYEEYLNQCEKILSMFSISNKTDSLNENNQNTYSSYRTNLLDGTKENPNLRHDTMKFVFDKLKIKKKIIEISSRVEKLIFKKDYTSIELLNNEKLNAKKIVFAAGVLGNAQIIFRSINEINKAEFHDHCAEIIIAGKINKLFNHDILSNQDSKLGNIEKIYNNRSYLLASHYNLNQEDLNFFLNYVSGLNFNMFRDIKIPFINKIVNPIQIWTEKTFKLKINNSHFDYDENNLKEEDKNIDDFKKYVLTKTNIFKSIKTKPGQGFHYHNLNFEIDSKMYSINDVLKSQFNNSAICIDASILEKVSPRPLTLTAMAVAAVQNFL